MPLYTYRCGACGLSTDLFRRVACRDVAPECFPCKELMPRVEVICPAFQADITPYESPVSGKRIKTRREQNADLRDNGYILAERGVREQIEKNKKRTLSESFSQIENRVLETAGALAASGRI